MIHPKQLISKSGDIYLTLLNEDHIDFIVSSAKKSELELIFGTPDKGCSLSEYIRKDLAWTFCYVISDKNSNYGIIKVVPEIDDVLSFHGIGWSDGFRFSRKYFNAWYLIHDFYFRSNNIFLSNCLLSNSSAIKVLVNTGYSPNFIINLHNDEHKISFDLTKDIFYSNVDIDYLKSNFLSENISKEIIFNRTIVNRDFFPNRRKSHIHKLEVINNFNLKFESQYIRSRLMINLKKEVFLLSFKTLKIKILVINFLNHNQYHLEINESVRIYDLLFIKLQLKEFFNKKLSGEIFFYNSRMYEIIFTNDYTFLGYDSFRENSIWKLK